MKRERDIMPHSKSIGRYISCIYRNFHKYMHNQLQTYDLGSGQFHFLMMLYRQDAVNQETLAETLQIDKATSARAIKKLEEKGYVTRIRDEQDRRNYNILLTEKAKTLKPKIKAILQNWTKILLTDLTTEEQQQLYILLEKITKNATEDHQQR
ncbi:MAG: MarR family transcriptional regulator [Thermoplasmatota archaeon]